MDRTDHARADWLMLVSTKLQVDDVDTEGESPLSVAERFYEHYAALSPRDAVSMYMAHRAGLKGHRTLVAKDIWIDRFTVHLQRISTATSIDGLKEFADSAYRLAWDLAPEEVADTYATADPASIGA